MISQKYTKRVMGWKGGGVILCLQILEFEGVTFFNGNPIKSIKFKSLRHLFLTVF